MSKLKDKVAIVTGGAMGNGLGIAKVFLKYEAQVVLFDYSDKIADTIIELRNQFPNSTVTGYKVDIRDMRMVTACMKDVFDKLGHIDVIVNNAGVNIGV